MTMNNADGFIDYWSNRRHEDFVEKTISAIIEGAKTGQVGDGKIFVSDLTECVRIRTGERGGKAIG